jgi:hypothetical protein
MYLFNSRPIQAEPTSRFHTKDLFHSAISCEHSFAAGVESNTDTCTGVYELNALSVMQFMCIQVGKILCDHTYHILFAHKRDTAFT